MLAKLDMHVHIYARASGRAYDLVVGHKSTNRICRELLGASLLLKRAQAQLVPSHTPANHLEVRAKLQQLKGNQGRFRRQDNAGIARALEIHKLQQRRSYLRRSSRIGQQPVAREVDELTDKIDSLRIVHQRKELEREICDTQSHLEKVRRASTVTASGVERAEPSALAALATSM